VERELRDGERELARKQSEYVEDLNVRRNEELGKLQNSLLQEVQAFAKAQNFDLIVGDGVLFAKDTMDVTSQVLAALTARGPRAAPAAAPKPAN
jgi:outer membrane protein